jgi:hypothetical protein
MVNPNPLVEKIDVQAEAIITSGTSVSPKGTKSLPDLNFQQTQFRQRPYLDTDYQMYPALVTGADAER